MSFFKKLFGGSNEQKPKSLLDQAQQLGGSMIVSKFRGLAKSNNCAPTNKTSDKKIMEIYSQVGTAFREVSEKRGERIPAGNLNYIIFNFIQKYEMVGEEFFNEHLKYEIEKYHTGGLRQDYLEQEIKFF